MAKIKVSDLLITSLETIMACNINGGVFRFMMDELQNATIANTQANDALTGRGGRTIGQLKRNKSVTVSGTNGMVSLGLVEAEIGSEGENKVTTVKVPDYVTSAADAAVTTYVAVGTVGNEIGEIYVKNSDGTVRVTLTQDATASAGKFAYDPATKAITFEAGEVADNEELVMYYKRQIQADVLTNISDNYSEKLELYVDALAEDKCKNIYRVQFFIPYADFSGNFELAMGDSQTNHGFEATSLASACGNGGTMFWTMTVFGVDAEDVA